MKGEVQLNVMAEPMEHFTTFDDNYLSSLISSHKTGDGLSAVVLKDNMKDVCKEVMAHWYNIKGDEF